MAVEHTYRYLHESTYVAGEGLGLATAGGRVDNPYFFRGFVENADQVARALLVVAEVARTRYFDAGVASRMRDPVVTSNRSVLRIESFSACNGVYARFDLDNAGFECDQLDWGTTNVDVNEPLRAALTGIGAGDPLRMSVGSEALQVDTLDESIVEKKVPLPDRWLKGFAEVQIASSGMMQVADLGTAAARAALRDLPLQKTGNRTMWVAFSKSGARLTQRSDGTSPSLVGPQRLAALRRLLPFARRLDVFAEPTRNRQPTGGRAASVEAPRASAWVIELDSARMTLVISPELYRGFSGEGAVLEALAAADDHAVADVASRLVGQANLDPNTLCAETSATLPQVMDALRVLGAAGRVGHDVRADGFFHRDLPFDRSTLEAMQPRLRDASDLVSGGAVHHADDRCLVESEGTTYTVRVTPDGSTCTCVWFAKHRGERGPCKHVLAAQLAIVRAGHQ